MDSLTKVMPLLGFNNLYREFIVFLGGLFGIIFLFTIAGSLVTVFEAALNGGGRFEFFVLVILIAYVIGKVVIVAMEFMTQFLYSLASFFANAFLNDKGTIRQRFTGTLSLGGSDWRRIFRRYLLRAGHPEQASEDDVKNLITYLDIAEVEQQYPSIRYTLDKLEITEIILRFACAYSVFGIAFNLRYASISLVVSLIALYFAYSRTGKFLTDINYGIAKRRFEEKRKMSDEGWPKS